MTGSAEQQLEIAVDGLTLSGVLHLPDSPPSAVIVGCHGLMADKSSPKQVALARRCTDAGMAYFRFDHRGCGQSQGDFESQTTLENRRSDLLAAVRCIEGRLGSALPKGLFGSSLGGTVCLTAAREISPFAMVTLAAPVQSRNIRMPEDSPDSLKKELLGNRLCFDVTTQLTSIHHVLIIHGSSDRTVAVHNAHRLYQLAQSPKKLLIMENGDHRISRRSHQEHFMRSSVQWWLECRRSRFDASRPPS